MAALGLEVAIYTVGPQRVNVAGVRRGRGGGRSLLWNGHLDTVPVASMWKTTPFALTQDPHDPDILRGLGTSDMKSGLAVMLDVAEESAPRTLPYDCCSFLLSRKKPTTKERASSPSGSP